MPKTKFTTKTITTLAILTAMEIILSRFLSINAWNIKIGFSFVPIVIAAMLLGPVEAGIVGALGDFVGALLFPIGPYFPGFTLTAFLTGITFGIFLHRARTWPRIIGAVAVNQLLLSLMLNTLWISILYGSPFAPLVITRLPQCAVLTAFQIIIIHIIDKAISSRIGKAVAV